MIRVGEITLGGVDLNNSLQWTNRYSWSPVAMAVDRTLGGGVVTFSTTLTKGQPIDLEADETTGWLNTAMVNAIVAQARTPGAVYTFEFYGETYSVVYSHDRAPAVSFSPLIFKDPRLLDNDDWFVGSIRLLTV